MKKIVLITGATTGIGKETAIYLSKKDYTVYGAGRRENKLKELETSGIKTIKMDVTDDSQMAQGIEKIIDKEGRIEGK